MDKNRRRLVVLFAQASLFAEVLRRELDDDKYEIVTLDDMCRAEAERDALFYLENLRTEDMQVSYVLEADDLPYKGAKRDRYKMPNAQRQYLQKWQPV